VSSQLLQFGAQRANALLMKRLALEQRPEQLLGRRRVLAVPLELSESRACPAIWASPSATSASACLTGPRISARAIAESTSRTPVSHSTAVKSQRAPHVRARSRLARRCPACRRAGSRTAPTGPLCRPASVEAREFPRLARTTQAPAGDRGWRRRPGP